MEAELNNEKEILTLATIAEDEEFDDESNMRMFLAKSYSHFNKKPAEDLIKEMIMTLDEESELFVKKEIMAYVNF
ncbi:hypothetical protein GLOIN_2v1779796 [Rhizophagus irregularis DAOM 181602=DAOM 197198]|nr:hypothetical protein GLOIN_2v1779796 [Rhizophagus irregularis DAOM 181602=DAOM 197198]